MEKKEKMETKCFDGNFKETKKTQDVCYVIGEDEGELCALQDTEYPIISADEIQKLATIMESRTRVKESTIEAMADTLTKWAGCKISSKEAMHDTWSLFQRDKELSAKLSAIKEENNKW